MKRSLALLLLCGACASHPQLRPEAASPALAAFVDEYFDRYFDYSPSAATENGLHQYDDRLEDRTPLRVKARLEELHAFQTRLRAIPREALSQDESIDALMLDQAIAGELLQLEVVRGWQKNPMDYAGAAGSLDGIMKRNYAPGPERLKSVIARLQQVPDYLAAARMNLTETPPKEFTDLAIRMAKGSSSFLETSLPIWAKDAAAGDARLLAELDKANAQAMSALRSFSTWLEKDLLPRSTGSYALGAETFAAELRHEEMIDLPLAELLAIGQARLDKDRADFIATARQIDPRLGPAEVMDTLNVDHPTAEDLIPAIARSLEEVRAFIRAKDLITIPSEVMPIVTETPPYARDGSYASMSTPGPFESKATEAYYYVTPVEKEWDAKHKEDHLKSFNRTVIAMIDIHEAFPGHYVQFLYSPRFPTKTRKLLGAASNFEGWAHYTEQMMLEAGYGAGDPRFHLAQLSEALLRDCRYVSGIKLHTAGWTVDQAAELFEKQCFIQPAVAFEEARRGAYNPTYLYYTFGKLEIQKLRDEYLKKTGKSLKQFHDEFVAVGPAPLPLVRKVLLK